MTDQVLHYSDQTQNARFAVRWLNHLFDYGVLTDAMVVNAVAAGNPGAYANLRAAIAAIGPPTVSFEAEHIIREAIGDNTGRPGVLGRANADGSMSDALIAGLGTQTVVGLATALAALVTPDAQDPADRATFAMQV